MSDQLPAPLVPAHVDLKDFPFFPMDAGRLRDSDLSVTATGEEFRAAVLLWCASWHQVPAASLPDDNALLAKFAGYGRTEMDAWLAVREGALRKFVKCSDGRLYHPVMAEKANDAWEGKLKLRHKRECERIKKAAQRAGVTPVYPPFDVWCAHVEATGSDKWEPAPGTSQGQSQGTNAGTNEGRPENVSNHVPAVSASDRGQGIGTGDRGEGQGKEQSSLRSDSSTAAPPTTTGGESSDGKLAARRAREREVTQDAITAFNAVLGKPNGLLPAVSLRVGLDTRIKHVKRCIQTASEICAEVYGNSTITPEFWAEYFGLCQADDFLSGRQQPGREHANWTPSFEYLTRREVMLQVFDRTAGDEAAA